LNGVVKKKKRPRKRTKNEEGLMKKLGIRRLDANSSHLVKRNVGAID
jgi:hypothetical protein